MKIRASIARIAQQFLPGLLLAVVVAGAMTVFRLPAMTRESDQMMERVTRLSAEVSRLSQEQAMPSVVLARHRGSICYLYALYTLEPPPGMRHWRLARTRVSGTGFVVANGIVATNRHVAEPWFDDDGDQDLIRRGAVPKLEKLLAFFPGLPSPVPLTDVEVSTSQDLAVARFASNAKTAGLRPVPLASTTAVPGDAVVVVGYPMGVTAMLAKSPRKVYQRLAYSRETIDIARDLAAHSLIRPSATYGHLGDVVDDKLIYDAPTAQGGSGGPVFNSQGQVIGVNAAYIDGFAGGTIGISVQALKPLIAAAERTPHTAVLTNPVAAPSPQSAEEKSDAGGADGVPADAGAELP